MKITLAGLLIFGTMMAHAQTDAIEVATAGGSMETATLMTPATNTFPGLVHTARHTMKVGCTRSRCANRKEAVAQGMVDDWGEVVTR